MRHLTQATFEDITRSLLDEANLQLQVFYKAFGTEQSDMIEKYGWFTFADLCEAVKFTEGEIHEQFLEDMLENIRFVFYDTGDTIRKYIYSYGDFDLLRGLTESDYELYCGFLEYDKFKGIYSEIIDVHW